MNPSSFASLLSFFMIISYIAVAQTIQPKGKTELQPFSFSDVKLLDSKWKQQLDETTIQKLYLYYLSLSVIESGVDTLPILVDAVRSKVSSSFNALSELNSLLIETGYLDAHRSKYEVTGYSIRESGIFLVEKDFPRIREREIRPGVGDVGYSISVTQCKNYQITETEFSESLAELSS